MKIDPSLPIGKTFRCGGNTLKVRKAKSGAIGDSCRFCAFDGEAYPGMFCRPHEDGHRPACMSGARKDDNCVFFQCVKKATPEVELRSAMQKVIDAQQNYINILEDDLNDAASYAADHGWGSMYIAEGAKANRAIERAKKKLEELNAK